MDNSHEQFDSKHSKLVKLSQSIVWRNVFIMLYVHLAALYGLYLLIFQAKWQTWLFVCIFHVVGGLGITGGAHRLWSHRSYKARLPIRIFLMIAQSVAFQNDVIEWARDHRGHHKWSETDADPHNSKRGFFFSHIGWLLVKKHPDVITKGKTLDLSDLYADPVLRFQRRLWPGIGLLLCFLVPTFLPNFWWGEKVWICFFTAGIMRYTVTLNATWAVNSVAHKYGNRPYDKYIDPRQSIVTSIVALGEGWHNYHHSFPSDYRTAELPYHFNFTTMFLDACSWFGQVHSMRITGRDTIESKKIRSGEAAI